MTENMRNSAETGGQDAAARRDDELQCRVFDDPYTNRNEKTEMTTNNTTSGYTQHPTVAPRSVRDDTPMELCQAGIVSEASWKEIRRLAEDQNRQYAVDAIEAVHCDGHLLGHTERQF